VAGRLGKLLPIGTLGPATGRDKSAPTHLQPPYPQKSRDTPGNNVACVRNLMSVYYQLPDHQRITLQGFFTDE
jgi:hypothetical protein